MIFSSLHSPDQTQIFHYNFRITSEFVLEQFVTVIQHRSVAEKPVGLSDSWKPVLLDGKPIRVYEYSEDFSVIKVLIKGTGGYRNILCTGKFCLDNNGLLLVELMMFDGEKIIKSFGFVMQGQNCLRLLP